MSYTVFIWITWCQLKKKNKTLLIQFKRKIPWHFSRYWDMKHLHLYSTRDLSLELASKDLKDFSETCYTEHSVSRERSTSKQEYNNEKLCIQNQNLTYLSKNPSFKSQLYWSIKVPVMQSVSIQSVICVFIIGLLFLIHYCLWSIWMLSRSS